jgi:hypothetical protein
MNRSESSTNSNRPFSFRSTFASWCGFSFKRLKPRSRQNRLRFERLEDRTLLTTFMPTTFSDGGLASGSLRDAVLQVNADPGSAIDIIQLQPGTYTLSIQNANGQENKGNLGDLDINTNANVLIIQGGGVPGSNSGPTIIDAGKVDRAFQIFHNLNNTEVIFKNLTILKGLAQDDGIEGRLPGTSEALGGAILSNDSTVILDHVIIRNNVALGGYGADGPTGAAGGDGFHARGGGLYLDGGSIELIDSEIRRNKAIGGNGGVGGAIGVNDADAIAHTGGNGVGAVGGGLFALRADVTLTTSIITSNLALGGTGGEGGNGDIFDKGTGGDGGLGGDGFGGGLYIAGGTVTLDSSTISKNGGIGGKGGEGGIGKSGGNGGAAGNATGGGLFANDNDSLTLTDTDLLVNFAQGGEGGGGHNGTAAVASHPDPNSGILGGGGIGGVGGAGWGGGLYAVNSQGPIMISGGLVKDNTAGGGLGGHAGLGADFGPNTEGGGLGGDGGMGGVAQGGGMFISADIQVDIDSTEVSANLAKAGFGGAGGEGDDETAGGGGAGGEGGFSRGGGILFNLGPDTPVNLTMSPILDNHAFGGGGGKGGFGGSADDDFDGNNDNAGDGGAGGDGGIAQGGGIFLGGGFDVEGILALTSLSLSTNEAIGGNGGHGRDGGHGETGGEGGDGGNGGAGQGGGLFADGGSVTVLASTISTNKAQGGGGAKGGRAGEATDEDGEAGGGGGTGGAGQGGGLFASISTIDITRSTIDNNQATGAEGGKGGKGGKASEEDGGDGGNGGTGGAGQGGGIYALGSTTTPTNSTVSNNTARGGKGGDGGRGGNGDDTDNGGAGGFGGDGGAIQGGGIYVSEESLTTLSDTITANRVRPSVGGEGAKGGTGGFLGLDGIGQGGSGGGVFNLNATVNSFNTLIAGNTAKIAPDFAGLFNIAMFNLLGIGDGSNLAPAYPVPDAQGNLVGKGTAPIDPLLGPLTTSNGGPTKTHALLVGSPAINMGANLFSPGPTDQRGVGFDRIVGGTIDIGAFEFKGRAGTK